MSKLFTQFVPISDMTIRGFFLMEVVEWQKRKKKSISIMTQGTPQEYISIVKELALKLGEKLNTILCFKEKEQAVDEGIKKVIETYSQSYAKR